MRVVQYHRHAVRSLRRMPVERKDQILTGITEIAALDDPLSHVDVRRMSGDWAGCFRLRVGSYRTIFRLINVDQTEVFEVLQVGPRGSIY